MEAAEYTPIYYLADESPAIIWGNGTFEAPLDEENISLEYCKKAGGKGFDERAQETLEDGETWTIKLYLSKRPDKSLWMVTVGGYIQLYVTKEEAEEDFTNLCSYINADDGIDSLDQYFGEGEEPTYTIEEIKPPYYIAEEGRDIVYGYYPGKLF